MFKNSKKWSMLFVLVLMLNLTFIPGTVHAGTLLEYLDAESASIQSNGNMVDNGKTYRCYNQGTYRNPVITSEQKRAGSYSIKYELPSSTLSPDRSEHYIEVNSSSYPTLNHHIWQQTKYLGLSVFIPTDFRNPTGWFLIYQIKQHSSINPSPNIAIEVDTAGNTRIALRHGTGRQDSSTITNYINIDTIANMKGKWTDFVIKFKLTTATDGVVEVWRKRSTETAYVKVLSYTGMTGFTHGETDNIEIKGGLYRTGMTINHKIYLDEIRYGNAYDDVKFPGSTIGTPSGPIIDNDNGSPGYTTTGTWTTSSSTGYNGGTYQYAGAGSSATAKWTYNITTAGTYKVSVIYKAGTNRASSAKYTINTAAGTQTAYVNQTLNDLAWVTLGTWSFNTGSATVTLDAAGSSGGSSPVVIADAVQFEKVTPPTVIIDNDTGAPGYTETGSWITSGNAGYNGGAYRYTSVGTAKTAVWNLNLPAAGNWKISVIYKAGTNRASAAKYNVATASGTQTVTVNQTLNDLTWITLGTWNFNAGGGVVTLDALNSTPATAVVIADAIKAEPQ